MPLSVLLCLAATVVALFLLRSLVWSGLRTAHRLVLRFVWPLGGYWQAHPFKAALATRFPRSFAWGAARLQPQRFTGLALTLIVCAMVYAVSLFAGLLDELHEAEGLVRFDEALNRALDAIRVEPVTGLFLWLTDLGGGPAIVTVALTATAFLWIENRRRYIPALWATLVGAHATTWAGKFLVGRARPEFLEIASAEWPSFPSGHATGSLAIYGFLAYIVLRRLVSPRARFEVVYWTVVLVALIGFSRVYLGVHFLSDVASGFLVGVFWLLAGVAIAEWPVAAKATAPDSPDCGRA
jgi:membrane-associated phospholipid phosphatase